MNSARADVARDPLANPATMTASANAVEPRSDFARLVAAALVAIVITMLAYVAALTPGAWFPRQDPVAWGARQLALVRGTGSLAGDKLVVTSSGADGSVLISLEADVRSDQYPAIAWSAIDIPEGADVRLLWRNDVAPARLNTAKISVESGRPLPTVLAGNPAWIGRIKGLALLVATRLDKPLHVRGVVAKPMGVFDVLRDRFREWLAYEPWTGESINAVTGGADLQDLPLPALAAAIGALTVAIWFGWTRLARRSVAWLPFAVIGVFVAGSAMLDVRYTWNLVRQVADTAARYKGMDWREKHLAAEDGELFAFIEKARAALPPPPARVFVAAEAHYLRGRAAYHLYPYNVFYDPVRDVMPRADQLRPGDWLLVYQRRGAQYDAAARRLRWDGGEPVAAELTLAGKGAALFRIE